MVDQEMKDWSGKSTLAMGVLPHLIGEMPQAGCQPEAEAQWLS